MKYIKTEDGIYVFEDFRKTRGESCLNHYGYVDKSGTWLLGTLKDWKKYKKAGTIKKLCDAWIIIPKGVKCNSFVRNVNENIDHFKNDSHIIYGAIWVIDSNGVPTLKPVAKMNDKGELELL